MSSHREAPEISKDPVADNTDVYAFVSPDDPDTVTLIANFIPLQSPTAARTSSSSATTSCTRSTSTTPATAPADITYQFRFTTEDPQPEHVPLQHRPDHLDHRHRTGTGRSTTRSPAHDRAAAEPSVLATGLTCPPVNVGVRSTPNYAATSPAQAVHDLGGGRKVFAGQRAEPSTSTSAASSTSGTLRPFQNAAPDPVGRPPPGVNGTQGLNVHTIAIQVPITDLTRDGQTPHRRAWTRIGHRRVGLGQPAQVAGVRRRDRHGRQLRPVRCRSPGWATRCSTRSSCRWRRRTSGTRLGPHERQAVRQVRDQAGAGRAAAGALPGRVPEPGRLHQAAGRPAGDPADRHPAGVVPGFQNYTGPVLADMLRLNLAVPPTAASRTRSAWSPVTRPASPTAAGSIDDVVTIELRAIAGADDPAGRPVVHAGRRRRRGHRRHDQHEPPHAVQSSRTSGTRPAATSPCPARRRPEEATTMALTPQRAANLAENPWAGRVRSSSTSGTGSAPSS